jgi:Lon protease-like protein
MSEYFKALKEFGGTARLFPLPNVVLFPYGVQPLHVFEKRYRHLVRDALAADRLLALVLLRPGWEQDYEGRPPIHPIACLGSIFGEEELDDGRYDLIVQGHRRVRILEELPGDTLYRRARVEVLHEDRPAEGPRLREMRQRLAQTVPAWFEGEKLVIEQFQEMFRSDLELGPLCDSLSYFLPLDVEFKQTLLATREVEERVRRLLNHLEGHSPPEPAAFPPEFSSN